MSGARSSMRSASHPRDVLTPVSHTTPEPVWVVDDEGVVVFASDSAAAMLGIQARRTSGPQRSVGHRVIPATTLGRALREVQRTGRNCRAVHRARLADGRHHWLESAIGVLATARERLFIVITRADPRVTPGSSAAVERITMCVERRDPSAANGDMRGCPPVNLTSRELQVLQYLGDGRSVAEVALMLEVQESTIRAHVKRLLEKLQVHSQLQAVLKGIRMGLVSIDLR